MTKYKFMNITYIQNIIKKIIVTMLLFVIVTSIVSLIGQADKVVKLQSPIVLRSPVYLEPRKKDVELMLIKHPNTQSLLEALEVKKVKAMVQESAEVSNAPLSSNLSTTEDIEKYIKQVFGKHGNNAVEIAKCESNLEPTRQGDNHITYNKNGKTYGYSTGIFQIRQLEGRPSKSQLEDPKFNIDYAYGIFKSNNYKFGTTSGWYNCAKKLWIK